MVKALVFGTKDLCVRIAPWPLYFFFFQTFSSRVALRPLRLEYVIRLYHSEPFYVAGD